MPGLGLRHHIQRAPRSTWLPGCGAGPANTGPHIGSQVEQCSPSRQDKVINA